MVESSPELIVIIMFGAAIIGILLGFPLAAVVGGIAVIVGLVTMGPSVFGILKARVWSIVINYSFLAAPLFIFMGLMVEKSGAADRLYDGLYVWFGGLRGGLAIATILLGTLLATCVGVISASIIMIGLIAIPSMLQKGYKRELICGTICAGGTLGILIPPSVMLVIYGPLASISVGQLFMAAFGPGLLLSAMYMVYIAIRCYIQPSYAPPRPVQEQGVPILTRLRMLITGIAPPLFLMFAVLGSIFFGVAAPTEAAGIGALAATLLAITYRRFNLQTLRYVMLQTMEIVSKCLFIGWGATMFTGVFLRLGGGEVIGNLVMAAPFGKWGAFLMIQFVVFILGMLIDWIAIVFIMIPLISRILPALGFDPLWFAMMIIVNLQTSFLTPPLAYAIFYLKGIVRPEWEITTGHIIRGIVPFVIIILVVLCILIAFPQVILWLPSIMLKR
jgi:tripartite ATP-independent transporter DctM subunit